MISELVELKDDPVSRTTAVLRDRAADVGDVLYEALPMSFVLLPLYKATRCDNCLREFALRKLKACSRCKMDYYCGEGCW